MYSIHVIIYLWIFILVFVPISCFATNRCGYDKRNFTHVFKPTHYDLDIKTNYDGQIFTVKEKIVFESEDPSNSDGIILLDSNGTINISSLRAIAKVRVGRDEQGDTIQSSLSIGAHCLDDEARLLVIWFNKNEWNSLIDSVNMSNGVLMTLSLFIKYQGFIVTNIDGLQMIPESENNSRLFVTRFDQNEGSYLFPCLNETIFSSRFSISLEIAKDETALANTEPKSIRYESQSKIIEFDETDIMPPHQVTFVIGHLYKITPDDLRTQLYLPKSLIELTTGQSLAISIQQRASMELASQFQVTFADKTFNIVAIPSIGDKEIHGPGLIICDIVNILQDLNKVNSLSIPDFAYKAIERVIRQWLGNDLLLDSTMDQWLFEGLVGWFSMELKYNIYQDFDDRLTFLKDTYDVALTRSSLTPNTESMLTSEGDVELYMETSKLSEQVNSLANAKLDQTSKVKSLGIIRMIHDICGTQRFEIVIRKLEYFNLRILRSADFIGIVREVCNWDPMKMIACFNSKNGHPLILADLDEKGSKLLVQVKQIHVNQANDGERCDLTITFRAHDTKSGYFEGRKILPKDIEVNKIELPYPIEDGKWIKLNRDFSGFYRIHYSDRLLIGLEHAVNRYELSDLDEFNLIADALALMRYNKIGAHYLIKILNILHKTNNIKILNAIIKAFIELKILYIETRFEFFIDQFGIELFKHVYDEDRLSPIVGLNKSETMDTILMMLVNLNHKNLRDDMTRFISQFDMSLLIEMDVLGSRTLIGTLARGESDWIFEHFISIIRPGMFEPSQLSSALALSNSFLRLELAWKFILNIYPDQADLFLKSASINKEGREFIRHILNSIPENLDLVKIIDTKTILKDFCVLIMSESEHCRDGSNISHIIGSNEWKQLKSEIDHMQSERSLAQGLDKMENLSMIHRTMLAVS